MSVNGVGGNGTDVLTVGGVVGGSTSDMDGCVDVMLDSVGERSGRCVGSVVGDRG